MKCSNCGNEIANDSVFCEYCGEKIQKNSKIPGWILFSVIFIGCLFGSIGISITSSLAWGIASFLFICYLIYFLVTYKEGRNS